MSEGFTLSYLYLDKYRTIKNAHVSFDHRYIFVQGADGRRRIGFESETKRRLAGPYFYGDHIYSMSCIVGKNGEGKTSTVDFIHESFLLMLKHINEGLLEVDGKSHKLINLDSRRQFYHLEKDTDFLVIFSVRGSDYYLTNISGIEPAEGVKPYTREYNDFIDLDLYSMVYFSQMRYRTGVARSELQHGRTRDMLADPWKDFDPDMDDNPYLTAEELFGRYKVDFSEERIDARRGAGTNVNFDILIQLVFIYMRKDLVVKCLGRKFLDRMRIHSAIYEGGDRDNDSMLSEAINGEGKVLNLDMINKIVRDPESYFDSAVHFTYEIPKASIKDPDGGKRRLSIEVNESDASKKQRYQNNINMFRLREAYAFQETEAERFYEKMLAYPESRLREIENHFKENSDYSVTVSDLEEALFREYFADPSDYTQKPMAKFYRDLYYNIKGWKQ